MHERNDPKNITCLLNCLSLFEHNTASMYQNLAEKVDLPLVKSLLLELSLDSEKHSALLKGVVESMPTVDSKIKDCPKMIGEAWRAVDAFSSEIDKIERISDEDLANLSEKLADFESVIGEDYHVFVQLKTLQLMANEIKLLYNINLEQVQDIFTEIIGDEGHHRIVLQTIREMLDRKTQEDAYNAPKVKFQDPDAWSRPLT